MQVQQICAILVLCLVAIEGKNQVIQCYVCDDCDIFDDCLLESCPPDIEVSTTAPPPTATSIETTSRPQTSTSQSTPGSTPTSSSSSTSPSTSTTNTPTTSLTTEPPYHTSTIPTTETEHTSQTETEITLTSETGGTSDTSTSAPITDPSSTESTSTSTSTSTNEPHTQIQLTRNITRASLAPSVSYHCYSIDVFENYKQKTKRGCVEVPEEESACGVLRKEYGCSSKNCKVCSTDGCNSNGALRGSLLAVIAITLFGLFSEKIRCERS